MKTFYALLLAATEFELTIARSTGRGAPSIRALTADKEDYRLQLFKLENLK